MVEKRQRKLAAILVADVVGYSRLMGEDEVGTLDLLRSYRFELIMPRIAEHEGHIVKLMGDGILAEFPSAVEAVQCAIEVQHLLSEANSGLPQERRVVFRIGINLGDVLVEDGDLYGDGVNIAARLEGMADPGGVLISRSVWDSVRNRLDVRFFDDGLRKFKNISQPIHVWSWPDKLAAVRAESKPRVFVAEFDGHSEEERLCAEDLGAELQAHLGRLTGLEVTGERCDAHYVIEGSVRLATGRARVYARLLSADGSRQIWSDRHIEDTDDPFEILDRCVPRIAMSVRRRIAADDAERLADRNLDELSLEELLSAAGVSFFTPTKAGWRGGGQIAEQALELAPKNFMALAMAAAGLGLAEFLYGYRRPEEATIELAFTRAEEALRLTNRSDMLHAVHSLLLLHAHRRHREAAAAGRRALELNSDYNMGHWVLGAAQVFNGDFNDGAESAMRAVNIDIRDPYVHLYSRIAGYGHLGAGRHKEATDWFQRADQLAPGLPPNLAALAVSECLEGNSQAAHDAVTQLASNDAGFCIAEMEPLPYRDEVVWANFAETLQRAGAPT